MVHDWWLQMASTAVNPFALVRASRNTPAVDSTSAAPPRSDNADPATATCTPGPVNRPGTAPSIAAVPLGDFGDPPPAENNVGSVAQDATWQAPAHNRRREPFVSGSDIVVTLV